MDAIKMLLDDHKKVKAMFRDFEKLGDEAYVGKQKIADEVFMELEVHTALEEEIFYPAVDAAGDDDETDLVAEGLEEHHVVKTLIAEMQAMTSKDETFNPKFKVMTENVEHHIKEEEEELLPDARKTLGDDKVNELGDQMAARKKQLMAKAAAA